MGGCPSEAKRSRPKLWVLGALRLQTTPGGAGERVPWCIYMPQPQRQYQIFPRIFTLSVYTPLEMAILHWYSRLTRTRFTVSPGRHDDRTSTRPPLHAAVAATVPTAVRLAAIATPKQGYATRVAMGPARGLDKRRQLAAEQR